MEENSTVLFEFISFPISSGLDYRRYNDGSGQIRTHDGDDIINLSSAEINKLYNVLNVSVNVEIK